MRPGQAGINVTEGLGDRNLFERSIAEIISEPESPQVLNGIRWNPEPFCLLASVQNLLDLYVTVTRAQSSWCCLVCIAVWV